MICFFNLWNLINKKILVNNQSRIKIIEQLQIAKYPMMIEKQLVKFEDLTQEQINDGNYDFLVKMPIYNLTKERIEELQAEQKYLENQITHLNSKTCKDLWMDDIKDFEKEYTTFMKSYYEDQALNPEEYLNTGLRLPRVMNMKKKKTNTTPTPK